MTTETKYRKRRRKPRPTPPRDGERTDALPIALRLDPTRDPARWIAAGGRPTCRGCVAHCCRYISVEIDPPSAKWQYDQVYWMLLHENVAVYQEREGGWYVEFTTRCRALTEKNLCSRYETRPQLCRDYSNESCPVWNKDELYKVRFEDAEAFAHWLEDRGVDWRFEWQKEGARRRETPRLRPRSRAASGETGRERARSPRA